MNEWITVANTAGAIVMAVLFSRLLSEERKARSEMEQRRDKNEERRLEALKHIGDECHAHSMKITETMSKALSESNQVIKENTRALGAVTQTYNELRIRMTAGKR